jgi:hypothetical protein
VTPPVPVQAVPAESSAGDRFGPASVTDNASAQVDSPVTSNADEDGCTRCDRLDRAGLESNRYNGLNRPHCRTCHSDRHYACVQCRQCLPNGHRLDRRYCSSTCRQKVFLYWRSPEGLAQIASEQARRETPEMRELAEAIRALGAALGGTKNDLHEAARERAETCGRCGTDISTSGIVWRLAHGLLEIEVFPVCFACRCESWIGKHLAKHCDDCGPEGSWAEVRWSCPNAYSRQHPDIYCDGCHPKMWHDPTPCEGDCGRLVANHRQVRPAFRRGPHGGYGGKNQYDGSHLPPRVFCSRRCRQVIAARERQENRVEVDPIICPECGERVDARRRDARYCSAACRQRAYRARTSA